MRCWFRLVSSFSLLCLSAVAATSQIPDTFTNLQLLDGEIQRGELVGVMRGWATDLGVRCNHCHVGPDDLQGMDFATDEKPAKRTARAMLAMVREINRSFSSLAVVHASGREQAQQVDCYTCHRTQSKPPRPTRDLLLEAMDEQGAEAVITRYSDLKDRHENAGRYDLRDVPLFQLGRSLIEQNRLEDAEKLLKAMLEVLPDSADSHVLLGQVYLMGGDLDAATEAIGAARRIEPENRFSNWLEGQIEAARSARREGDGGRR